MIRGADERARRELPHGLLVDAYSHADLGRLYSASEKAVLAYQSLLGDTYGGSYRRGGAAAPTGTLVDILGGVTLAAGKEASVGFGAAFDHKSPAVLQAIRAQAAELVVEVTEETKAALRNVISRAYVAGRSPTKFAREIRGSVGLTKAHARAVSNLGDRLAKQGLGPAAIAKKQRAYTEKLHRYRSMNIARTETVRAANLGLEEGWKQAQAAGKLAGFQRKWIVTPDDRLCDFCRPMAGVTTPIGKPFPTPTGGETQGPPLHPSCRCAQGLVRDPNYVAPTAPVNEPPLPPGVPVVTPPAGAPAIWPEIPPANEALYKAKLAEVKVGDTYLIRQGGRSGPYAAVDVVDVRYELGEQGQRLRKQKTVFILRADGRIEGTVASNLYRPRYPKTLEEAAEVSRRRVEILRKYGRINVLGKAERFADPVKRPLAAAKMKENLEASEKVLREMDVLPSTVDVKDYERKFKVAGVTYVEGGHYNPSDGRITVRARLAAFGTPQDVAGLIAHEATHTIFDVVVRRAGGLFTKAAGPDAAVARFVAKHGAALEAFDGVTEYSRSYWRAYAKGGTGPVRLPSGFISDAAYRKESAINETLAEMSKLKAQGKTFAAEGVAAEWVELYDLLFSMYRAAGGAGASRI